MLGDRSVSTKVPLIQQPRDEASTIATPVIHRAQAVRESRPPLSGDIEIHVGCGVQRPRSSRR